MCVCVSVCYILQKFVENFPEFRKLSGTVSKHVAVISEMSRIVREHQLMEVSETEQDIATQGEKRVILDVCHFFVSCRAGTFANLCSSCIDTCMCMCVCMHVRCSDV